MSYQHLTDQEILEIRTISVIPMWKLRLYLQQKIADLVPDKIFQLRIDGGRHSVVTTETLQKVKKYLEEADNNVE